ncbi:MAG: membrane-bound lytic murein transglycosylase MltF [Gammaproteobacteria bacterium]|nr:membrane-bound lytic murein transglycosylase MltF [Gammaproteobacteria bacterium]NNF61457.1 membrane-bound lytic murein transglycosylase MltF [Gammaproteobacteria bacterium]NNM21177.1 membrane-bound lytic murein transglycosylase MltF [Gammaproteobacteria bacterium]
MKLPGSGYHPLGGGVRLVIAILMLDACVFLSTCSVPPPLLDTILERGTLRVVTRNSPTTYFWASDGPAGPEYELARAFADSLGVRLEIYSADTFDGVIPDLLNYRADIAAAGLTITEQRASELVFAPPYQEISQQVVYRMGRKRPREINDLLGKHIAVTAGSSHAEVLREIQQELPGLAWTEVPASDGDQLMYEVAQKNYDVTVTDSNEFEISRRYHPALRTAMTLGEKDQLAWALRRREDPSLYQAVREFFDSADGQALVASLHDKYYDDRNELDYVGTRRFLRHVESRLPQYKALFQAAAVQNELDWQLLAAVGYQESHWDHSAVSPTGVRGIMMLTKATARQLGIKDRLDLQASIFGGARYLKRLRQKIPERIPEPDRTWMVLAAYNVGFGHLEDARILTQRHGKDPDRWIDVREHLPLLAQHKYHSTLKRGYARGWEPVIYVDNIRNYYDLLQWYHSDRNRETPVTASASAPRGEKRLQHLATLVGQ